MEHGIAPNHELHGRLSRLETSHRRAVALTTIGWSVILAFTLISATSDDSEVEARRFRLLDAQGNVTGEWSSSFAGSEGSFGDASLVHYADTEGTPRMLLLGGVEPSLRLFTGTNLAEPGAAQVVLGVGMGDGELRPFLNLMGSNEDTFANEATSRSTTVTVPWGEDSSSFYVVTPSDLHYSVP